MIHIGTSGWQYRDWKDRLYAGVPQRAWLAHYATYFPTVELNNSFYRLPEEEAFARWRSQVPEGFVMAVKASRFLTHMKRLREPAGPVELLWGRARALGPVLGPVLFQLPPRFPADIERLRGLLDVLPAEMRAAVEFRDPSWYRDDVYDALDRAGAALVLPDTPGARIPDVVTAGWSYVRFHKGRPDAVDYTREKLRRWADRVAALPSRETWVYFNNDGGGAAVRDALAFAEMLAARGAAAEPAA